MICGYRFLRWESQILGGEPEILNGRSRILDDESQILADESQILDGESETAGANRRSSRLNLPVAGVEEPVRHHQFDGTMGGMTFDFDVASVVDGDEECHRRARLNAEL